MAAYASRPSHSTENTSYVVKGYRHAQNEDRCWIRLMGHSSAEPDHQYQVIMPIIFHSSVSVIWTVVLIVGTLE